MTTDDSETVVRFENVGLRYGLGPEVLQDVTFSLAAGSFHFLVGDSGAGKSSLLKLIYLALKPSRGLISLFGRDIATTPRRELPAMRRRVGVVFQEFRLLNHLSAFDNVALPLRVAGVRKSDIQKHVVELLSWVGLKDHLDARPPTLSGGQQQQLAIARALVNDPKVLLLDEPSRAMDALTKSIMHESLLEVYDRTKVTIFFITHDLEEAIFLGDRVVVMTTRPAKTKKIVNVAIKRPRDYTVLSSEEFRLLVSEAKGAVHEEAIKAFEAGERELA